jgi:hypothetical protein
LDSITVMRSERHMPHRFGHLLIGAYFVTETNPVNSAQRRSEVAWTTPQPRHIARVTPYGMEVSRTS